ncbi:hypothetical protein [Luteimonas sp. J16]|uniref:hypothetical protein n=1 Tax=Luteimonas sp. J16 TaxID=935283 RepID=UPI001C97B255|nr:hypothetical protein [Luteimonas sp. J16]
MAHRLHRIAAPLGEFGQLALGLGHRHLRVARTVVAQCPRQQVVRVVEFAAAGDQALGQHQARAPRARLEAGGLEFRQRLHRPRQRFVRLALRGEHLAHAVAGIGGVDPVAGRVAGFHLPPPDSAGLGVVLGQLLGQREVGQGMADGATVVAALHHRQPAQGQFPRLAGLAHQRMQVAGHPQHPRRVVGGLGHVGQGLAQPGERGGPVLEVGGDAGPGGERLHLEAGRHLLAEQLGEAFDRLLEAAGDAQVAQAHVLQPLALRRGELVEPVRQRLDAFVGFAPVLGEVEPLDLAQLRFQGLVARRRRGQQRQQQQD